MKDHMQHGVVLGWAVLSPNWGALLHLTSQQQNIGIKKGQSGERPANLKGVRTDLVAHPSLRPPLSQGVRCLLSSLAPACMCVG